MSRLTQDPENVSQAIRWYFGGGLGCSLFSLAAIGMTHRGLDPTGYVALSSFLKQSSEFSNLVLGGSEGYVY